MGKPKLVLPWGDTSILGHLLQQWKAIRVAQIVVVYAAESGPISGELDRLGFPESNRILNPAPAGGMFSSIRCAAAWPGWRADLTHWIITLGDQPQLGAATLQSLLNFGARNPEKICQPMRNERRRHPVMLPQRFFAELKKTPAADMKMFLVEHTKDLSGFESSDEGLDFDVDTPEDYERIQRIFLRPAE